MSAAVAWLDARCAEVPAGLLDRVREAVLASAQTLSADREPVSQVLMDAAVSCMNAALQQGPQREAAVDLLAADALLTWACEAAVDEGAGRLGALAVETSLRLVSPSAKRSDEH